MNLHKFHSGNPFGFTDQEKWHLDEVIMQYWEARSEEDKRKIELECYKQFKCTGFKSCYIDYLKENNCSELADEMKHFFTVFRKVSHTHEKSLAA